MNRQIALDTETTGMNDKDPIYQNHGIIEIGAVEMIHRRRTGRVFHAYVKPIYPISEASKEVHGIEEAFLQDKPDFKAIAQDLISFIKGAELIAHNANFDLSFLNEELKRANYFDDQGVLVQVEDICTVSDTLKIARKRFPCRRNSLDALCKRLEIPLGKRVHQHGALLDAKLLSRVYLALTSGQSGLDFQTEKIIDEKERLKGPSFLGDLPFRNSEQKTLILYADQDELALHKAYLEGLKQASGGTCFWTGRPDGWPTERL